jgi:hypothetical protein
VALNKGYIFVIFLIITLVFVKFEVGSKEEISVAPFALGHQLAKA